MTATITRSATATAPAPSRPAPVADQPTRRADLRVVDADRRSRRPGLKLALAVILVFGTLFANAIFHAVLVTDQARLDQQNQRVAAAQSLNMERQLRVANLEAPQRIVDAAKAQGMRLPDTVHWVVPPSANGGSIASTMSRVSPTTTTPGASGLAAGTSSSATTTPQHQ